MFSICNSTAGIDVKTNPDERFGFLRANASNSGETQTPSVTEGHFGVPSAELMPFASNRRARDVGINGGSVLRTLASTFIYGDTSETGSTISTGAFTTQNWQNRELFNTNITSMAMNSSATFVGSLIGQRSSTMRFSRSSNGPHIGSNVFTTTTTAANVIFDINDILEEINNNANMENISKFAREWYEEFEHVSETYILTLLAGLGIMFNFLAIVIISWDRRIWPMSRILNNLFLFSEQIFLGLIIAYLQLRSLYPRKSQRSDPSQLELFNYLTAALGFAQTFSTWMLYVVAMDAYRSVRQLTISEKIFQIRRAPLYVVALLLMVGGFYAPYIPPVRVELYHFLNTTNFTLCNVPLENHWDFVAPDPQRHDLYYIMYYSIGYTVFAYLVPFFLICCRDKDIIDVLHNAQEQKALLPSRSYVLCPAVAVSVVCNVYLVCVALKMVILTFNIFQYVDNYVSETAVIFFKYLNVYSNFLQVLKSSLYFFILLIYNKRLRQVVFMRLRRSSDTRVIDA